MTVSSAALMPEYGNIRVKTWIAVSSGVILLLASDILARLYHAVPFVLSLIDIFSSPSIPVFFSLITILPVAVIAYQKCIHDCDLRPGLSKVRPVLIGILFGSSFLALFMLSLALKGDEAQQRYVLRLASFSEYLRGSGNFELIAFIFSVHLFRPILEELVFRGLIFQSISAKYGVVLGVGVSSGIFSVIHWGLEFMPVLAFVFGAVSCGLVKFSRGMAASFSFHISYNSLITILGFLRGS